MDFVNFETAKQLKEKGVPQGPENFFWRSYDDWTNHAEYYHFDERRSTLSQTNNCKWKMWYEPTINRNELYIAPTISQVLKWLREKKGIHICITLGEFSDWVYEVSYIDGNIFCKAEDDFNSYEQAALAGIAYVLDNLI